MMLYSLIYTEEAYLDLREIVSWYKEQRIDLDAEFLLSVDVALSQIQRSPLGYPPSLNDTRQILLRRFPYKIIYKVYNNTIKIYGVFIIQEVLTLLEIVSHKKLIPRSVSPQTETTR